MKDCEVIIAVEPKLKGMSRIADRLEAQPLLPTARALKYNLDQALNRAHQRNAIAAVVLPSGRPDLLLLAAFGRPKADRIAVYHTSGPTESSTYLFSRFSNKLDPLRGLRAAQMRAAFALVDTTIVPDRLAEKSAVYAGADPEGIVLTDDPRLLNRIVSEPQRKPRSRAAMEAAVSLALDAALASGVIDWLERLTPDRGVNVVNYHRVLPLEELSTYGRPQMALAEPMFEAQLEMMSAFGFTTVSNLRKEDAKGRIALTFDDGYEDNFRVAFPLLMKFSAPACIFLVTSLVDQPEALWWDKVGFSLFTYFRLESTDPIPTELPPRAQKLRGITSLAKARQIISGVLGDLNQVSQEERERAIRAAESLVPRQQERRTMLSWNEIDKMSSAGINFGSHTRSHVVLDDLGPEEARDELFGSQDELEQRFQSTPVKTTALPRGCLGPLSVEELKEKFDVVMTTEAGVNPVDDDSVFVRRRDGRMLTLAGRHHPGKLRLELTGLVDRVRSAYHKARGVK